MDQSSICIDSDFMMTLILTVTMVTDSFSAMALILTFMMVILTMTVMLALF